MSLFDIFKEDAKPVDAIRSGKELKERQGLFDIFKEDAKPVDAIRSGKELRERQEELEKNKGGITEELMKQNPDLFNQITSSFSTPVVGNKFTIGDMFTAKSALQGNPFGMFGLGLMALQNLPPETPEQKAVKSLYDLDNIGRVQSGIMAGYNPISGFGPTGLSGAMDRRLDTIRRTELKRRAKGLELSRQLKERRKALEEAIAREQAAMRSTIESQYRGQEGQFGGPDRQTEREQAGPGYDSISEAGSFRYGGIASL